MRTIAPPAATPSPDAGYQAMLDQAAAAVDRIRQQIITARNAEPARRAHSLTDLVTHLRTAADRLQEQLRQHADDCWPPLPPTDEAP
ncbi:hypothetical protein AB0H83_29770 [Dactylosporangium sp. NPDC050688]|uniref:hypothetical protein n=1 Tax=Dactylosporangium sp. NPDC050688 TaxID=3157217 RepID=UPI0033E1ED56